MSKSTAEAGDKSKQVESQLGVNDALNIITSYFPEEWTSANEEDVEIVRISGGYMNTVYLVKRKSESIVEPNQLILRRKGGGIIQVDTSRDRASDFMASEPEEALITLEASKATIGPELYGVFSGGRLEEYVHSHTLTAQDVADKCISRNLAKAFARFHSMHVPYRKASFHRIKNHVYNNIDQFQQNISYIIDPIIKQVFKDAPGPIDWDYIKSFDFTTEFRWVCKVLDRVTYRMVITAGDPNYLNVLVREDATPADKLKVVLVDYELAVYQPRGIELGGHIANRLFSWNAAVNKASGFDILSDEERKEFIHHYTEEIHRLNKLDKLDRTDLDSSEHIMQETDIGILYYLVQFSFFITSNLNSFKGDLSFPTGAELQMKKYLQIKQHLMAKYPHWRSIE